MDPKIHILKTPAGADTSADVRKALFDSVDFTNQLHGGHLAGFALIAWDGYGNGTPICYHGRTSPMSDDMLPAFAMSQLTKLNVLLMQAELEEDEPATEG